MRAERSQPSSFRLYAGFRFRAFLESAASQNSSCLQSACHDEDYDGGGAQADKGVKTPQGYAPEPIVEASENIGEQTGAVVARPDPPDGPQTGRYPW